MTDKEFRNLKRGDFIEIIYQYQKREQLLMKENEKLHQQLEDKYTRIRNAGSIAEAALSLNHVLEDVQSAADQYLDEIKVLRDRAAAGLPEEEWPVSLEADPLVELPDMDIPRPAGSHLSSDSQNHRKSRERQNPAAPERNSGEAASCDRTARTFEMSEEEELNELLRSIRDDIDWS